MEDRFKFRAWNSDLNRMLGVDTHNIGAMRYFSTLMQCTGRTSRDGVLIMEADILAHENDNVVYVVEWRESCCGFIAQVPERQRFDHFIHPCNWHHMAIVGNVHANPELLETI